MHRSKSRYKHRCECQRLSVHVHVLVLPSRCRPGAEVKSDVADPGSGRAKGACKEIRPHRHTLVANMSLAVLLALPPAIRRWEAPRPSIPAGCLRRFQRRLGRRAWPAIQDVLEHVASEEGWLLLQATQSRVSGPSSFVVDPLAAVTLWPRMCDVRGHATVEFNASQ